MLPAAIPAPAPEVQDLASALADVLAALKAGSGALAAAESALPDLLAASQSISNIGADIKKPENQAYLAWAILQVYGI